MIKNSNASEIIAEDIISFAIPYCNIVKEGDRYKISIPQNYLRLRSDIVALLEEIRRKLNQGDYVLIVQVTCIKEPNVKRKKRVQKVTQTQVQ